MNDKTTVPRGRGDAQGSGMMDRPDRVQIRERSGIWEVKVDGKFHGDYHQEEHAVAAAALVKSSTL